MISIDPYLQHTFLDFASDAEVTAIKIHCKHFVPCVLICCYKPSASNSILPLIEYMHNIRKTHPGHSLILTGAFNLPGINWHNTVMSTKWSPMYADFVELLADLDLEQLITEPTHVAGNILDLFCTNIDSSKCSISVIKPGLSDHYMIECTLNIGHTLVNELKNSSRMLVYNNVDKDEFRNSMGNLLVNIQSLVVKNTNINDILQEYMFQSLNLFPQGTSSLEHLHNLSGLTKKLK